MIIIIHCLKAQTPEQILHRAFVEPHGQARLWPLLGYGTNSCHALSSMAGGDIPEAEVYYIPGRRPGPAKGVKLTWRIKQRYPRI